MECYQIHISQLQKSENSLHGFVSHDLLVLKIQEKTASNIEDLVALLSVNIPKDAELIVIVHNELPKYFNAMRNCLRK